MNWPDSRLCFFRKSHLNSSPCQCRRKWGARTEKASPSPSPTSTANAVAAPLRPPRLHCPRVHPLPGLAAAATQRTTPRPHPGQRRAPACGGTRPLRSRWHNRKHRTHLRGVPAPASAGLGAPDPQRGSRGPRFQPKAGRRAKRKGKAGRGCVRAAAGGQILTCEPVANSILPRWAPASSQHAATGASLATGPRTEVARGRAARSLRPELRRAGGGAHSAPGTGGAHRAAHSAPRRQPSRLPLQDPNFATGELRFAGGARGAAAGSRPGWLPIWGRRAPPCSGGREWSRPARFCAGEMRGGSPGAASCWHARLRRPPNLCRVCSR